MSPEDRPAKIKNGVYVEELLTDNEGTKIDTIPTGNG